MNPEPNHEELPVERVEYSSAPCKENGGPSCVKASYLNGEAGFDAFFFPEAKLAWLSNKFRVWWATLNGGLPAPKTVEEAIARAPEELKVPSHIVVDRTAKFPEIVSYQWRS